MLRVLVIPFLTAVGLIIVAMLLPSKHDTSVAAWWTRVRVQMMFFARAVLALMCVWAVVWFVLLRMLGWR